MPIQLKTIHKEISEALEIFTSMRSKNDYMKAIRKLLALKQRIEEELKKEEGPKEYSKKLQHLMGWYLRLWNDKPPEFLRFSSPKTIIGKHLKELIYIYEQNGEDIDQLKQDYEDFLKNWKGRGDKGILHFRSVLPQLKQNSPKSWTTPENQRGMDYYLQNLFGDENCLGDRKRREEA